MEGGNIDILILGSGLVGVVIFGALLVLLKTFSKGRKQTRGKLERFQQRFSNKRLKGEQARSIRAKQKETGLAGQLAELIPQQEQIEIRLAKAGLQTSMSRYATMSGVLALVAIVTMLMAGSSASLSLMSGIIAGLGLPHMFVSNRINARTKKFTKQFPEAIDLMVRGLKSGLPVNECIANVAKELPAPTGVEFQKITDAMRLGKQLEEALWETADRLDTADFKFFVISLVVQRETGGNLGETLGNLAHILRQRQSMKLKVKSLSSEAKASAWIVGSLPFLMLAAIMMLNYDYGIVLFTNAKAIAIGTGTLIWMALGIFIMSRMISFEV